VVVSYDASRGAPAVLGRHAIPDAGLYSVCLAIQNLWLAATAEDLGVAGCPSTGSRFLAELLGMAGRVRPVAGSASAPSPTSTRPDLERHGWRSVALLAEAVHADGGAGVSASVP